MTEIETVVGTKCGSQNSAITYRDENGKIQTASTRTCVRYPKGFTHDCPNGMKPIVGDEAWGFDDTFTPLYLGLVEKDEGVQQMIDILNTLPFPKNVNLIVLASPAMQIHEGNIQGTNRLVKAIETVSPVGKIQELSEGMCSAVYLLNDPHAILSSTFFTLNLGSSTTEFGCVSQGNIVHLSAHPEVSGNTVDDAIMNKARNAVSCAMFTRTEICKMKEAMSLNERKEFKLRGMTRNNFIEAEISEEMTASVNEYIEAVTDLVKNEILSSGKISPSIRRKAIDMPLFVSGGMSNIPGLPERMITYLNEKINYEFKVEYPKNRDGHIAPSIGAFLLAEAITKEE